MMEANLSFEILKSLKLLSWTACSVGWERGWLTKGNLSDYATTRLESDVDDGDLAAVATLVSADQLNASEIGELLKQLAERDAEPSEIVLDKWRLARLLELQATQLDWDEKVTHLEELGAEFSYPADMRLCSRYVSGEQVQNSDPLDAMDEVICKLKKQLGAD